MPAFVDALDLPTCKGKLKKGQFEYSCGLSLAEASIAGIGERHWTVRSIRARGLLNAAHTVHHNQPNHDPRATLYFTSKNSRVLSATCSCLFDGPFNA